MSYGGYYILPRGDQATSDCPLVESRRDACGQPCQDVVTESSCMPHTENRERERGGETRETCDPSWMDPRAVFFGRSCQSSEVATTKITGHFFVFTEKSVQTRGTLERAKACSSPMQARSSKKSGSGGYQNHRGGPVKSAKLDLHRVRQYLSRPSPTSQLSHLPSFSHPINTQRPTPFTCDNNVFGFSIHLQQHSILSTFPHILKKHYQNASQGRRQEARLQGPCHCLQGS